MMRIGLDFDNTIVCYDAVFHEAALEAGLIPRSVHRSKDAVRDYLRTAGRNKDWTKLQGRVYGVKTATCRPFEGALSVIHALARRSDVAIISHKTKVPYRGPRHDLHAAARSWIQACGLSEVLGERNIFFETTREDKLARIRHLECTHFVDDLPEFLDAPNFPAGVYRILFDPWNRHQDETRFLRAASWQEMGRLLESHLR
jgi:hypothetical protein